jgi:hypothetical protein
LSDKFSSNVDEKQGKDLGGLFLLLTDTYLKLKRKILENAPRDTVS